MLANAVGLFWDRDSFETDRPGTSEEVQIIPPGFRFVGSCPIRSSLGSLISSRIQRCLIFEPLTVERPT
jgi:hypothetical protein